MPERGREESGHASVRIDVLGPLRMTVGGTEVRVPGTKRRAVLALMVRAGGRVVTVAELVDALWPDGPPDSGRASLQSHVSRLRGHLGPAASRLAGIEGGYRLALHDGELDASEARALLAEARLLLTRDPAAAAARASAGAGLWRGAPLPDLTDIAPIAAWCVALDELRRELEETYIEAAITAGNATEVVGTARQLVAADATRESSVRLLMRALWRSGRASEALRTGHDFRRELRTATALEPSPALRELESEIASDPAGGHSAGRITVTRLHGRDGDLAALQHLLAAERLVTIVGPGGVGKTRLALEVVRRFDQAAVLLLAPVSDPATIPHALAAAIDLRVRRGDTLAACAALLGAGPTLLVIDNCEHLCGAVRDVVAELLATCPELTVLATSREPLGLAAEARMRLAPLVLPDEHIDADVEQAPAMALFLERARRARPELSPTVSDLQLIGDLTRRLDGLPLAIELAAGRLSAISLADLHARLDEALDLLADRRAAVDIRHSTLRRTIQWSSDLLPAGERTLFAHLAAFPDGFDLATAEWVAAELAMPSPTSALAHLVDASMLEPDLAPPARYRLLETVRAFALDQLATADRELASARLARWASRVAASIAAATHGEDEPAGDALLRRELGNLRAAWRLARDAGPLDDAVQMVLDLGDPAGWRDLTEIWEWAIELAADQRLERHPRSAAVLGLAANSAWARGELAEAERLIERGTARAHDDEGRWQCLSASALVALTRGQLEQAITHATAAAALAPHADQNFGAAALAAAYLGRSDTAWALLERLAAIAVSPTLRGFHSYVAAEIENLAGNAESAEEHYARAIELTRRSGATFIHGIASVGLMTLWASTGRTSDALRGSRDLIDYWERTHGWAQQWTTLRNLARLLNDLGDSPTAFFLEAAADHAPDAPADSPSGAEAAIDAARAEELRTAASSTRRDRVLAIARESIELQLARLAPATPDAGDRG